MKRLLNRDQLFFLAEKAADANNTAGGFLATLALKPISLLVGSLKQGYRKQQLEILALQWAGEYAKAVQPKLINNDFDINTEIQEVDNVNSENSEDVEIPNINSVIDIDVKKPEITTEEITKELQQDLETVNQIITLLQQLPANGILDDVIFTKFKDLISDLETIYFEEYLRHIENIIPESDLSLIISNIKSYNTFIETIYQARTATELKNIFSSAFKTTYPIKLKEIKEILTKLRQQFNTVLYILQQSNSSNDVQPDPTIITQQKQDLKNALAGSKIQKEKLSIIGILNSINEAKFKIPKEPNDIISELDLQTIIQQNPNIKNEATKRINFVRLDLLEYEAQFILNKSKNSSSIEKYSDLQRIWDISIKKINDYFQSVIDINYVMQKVKPQANNDAQQRISADDAQLTNLEKMNITEVFTVGQQFNSDQVYAFDCTITGIKSISTTLILSPTDKFADKNNIETVYWFKLLGAYRYDAKSNSNVKLKIFKTISSNQKLIDNSSFTYIAMRNLRPSTNAGSMSFIYSDTGNIYFNNTEFSDTDQIKSELRQNIGSGNFNDKVKNLMKIGNVLRVKINQRFIINNDDISQNKFPGIDLKTVNIDQNIEKAQNNHTKLINIIEPTIPNDN